VGPTWQVRASWIIMDPSFFLMADDVRYIYNTYIYIYTYIYIDIYIYITNWILTWLMFDMDHNLVSVVFHYFPHILSSWFNILNAHTWISLIFVWGCS
jgi:hypothetical protein